MDLDATATRSEHKAVLPTQGIAERYDIVVDFSEVQGGHKLYFVNTMHHDTGSGQGEDPAARTSCRRSTSRC
jgi:hypothetical protein